MTLLQAKASAVCELYNDGKGLESELSINQQVANAISNAKSMLDSGRVDEAESEIENACKATKNPYSLYVLGMLYKYLSDFSYFSVDYTLKGFMPENAENKEKSLALEAKKKECFYKALQAIEMAPEPKSGLLVFLKFLILSKLERFAEASQVLSALSQKDKDLYDYASMVFAVETNSKQAKAALEKQLLSGNRNAVYYSAKYLAKNGKSDDAKELINSAKKIGISLRLSFPIEKQIEQSEAVYK